VFNKILIANRGEIALRIVRACRELSIKTVVVYSKADKDSLPVKIADEAVCIGDSQSSSSYLNIPGIISAAEITDVDAIHPGYGFLSENTHFAEICESCQIKFIGPTPQNIKKMGNKSLARDNAKKNGIPIIPGSKSTIKNKKEALYIAKKIGYPLIIKAVGGGGGKGMRVAHNEISLLNSLGVAKTLLDENKNYYFMEMNTRIQVEHPITEIITDIDLIKEQIKIAAGEKLIYQQKDIKIKNWAIECRINAEDWENNFSPSPGKIDVWIAPGGPGVRLDTAAYAGFTVSPYYDSMIAKLIVYGRTRDEAILIMQRALDEFVIEPIKTTIPLYKKIFAKETFQKGNFHTQIIEEFLKEKNSNN